MFLPNRARIILGGRFNADKLRWIEEDAIMPQTRWLVSSGFARVAAGRAAEERNCPDRL